MARAYTWIKTESIRCYPESFQDKPANYVVKTLQEMGLGARIIGTELGGNPGGFHHFSLGRYFSRRKQYVYPVPSSIVIPRSFEEH